jgi:cyanophycinase
MNRILLLIGILLISHSLYSQETNNEVTTGPPNGTLLLMGGNASDSLFFPVFQELIGGYDQPIVVVPTARRREAINYFDFPGRQKRRFEEAGFKDVTILHTRSRKEANSEEFVEPLREAKGVWLMGGRQWRLVNAYLNTLTHLEMISLLQRGGVVAGTSAGATIQGSYLVRGDTTTNTIMMGSHEEGFGFIKNVAIDQHLLARNRHFDMFEVLEEHPDLLGLGLDENTGILVKGNSFDVIGESYVAVYDGTRWSAEKDTVIQLDEGQQQFYFLDEGDQYNMKKNKVLPGRKYEVE